MDVLAFYRLLCGLSAVLGMVSLPLHVKHANYAAASLIVWLTLSNLSSLLNSPFWPDDTATTHGWDGRGYCDVQVKLLLGAFAGTVGSTAVLARSVAGILSPDAICAFRTQHAVRAGRIEGLMLCVALPAAVMATHYVVQPNRYCLAAVSGCTATVFPAWPAIVLLFIWPPISALFAAYYGCTSLPQSDPVGADDGRSRDAVAASQVQEAREGPQTSVARFARLAVLALVLVLLYVPAAFFALSINLNHQFYPYSWAAVHDADTWRLDAIPRNPATAATAAAAAAAATPPGPAGPAVSPSTAASPSAPACSSSLSLALAAKPWPSIAAG